ncbi:MAG: hypothetical protein CFE41_01150 [Burkholderiales bacterium PBB2]|nr:MAG: hypothetical protein CFE41_01150 [Burkholderiales bacterium PBB2]
MCRSKRRALSLVGVAVTLATTLSTSPLVRAQGSDAGKADAGKSSTSNKAEMTPAERAQRDADKVFQWIRLHADKPGAKPAIILPGQNSPAAAPAPAPAPVAAKSGANRTPERNGGADLAAAKRSGAPSERKGITETVSDIAPASTQTAAAQPTEPAPEPTRLAAASLSAASVPPTLPETLASPPAAASPAFAEPPAPAVETPLKAIKMVEPEFPRQLQSTLRSGSVQVRFTVNPDGTVGRAEAIQTTHRRLSPAALEAVNQWRFEPIAKAREATVELVFRLE